MVVSMTQLGTYDQAKTMLLPILGDNKGLHLASALTAAVVYSYASLPLVSVLDHGFENRTVETTTARCACRLWTSRRMLDQIGRGVDTVKRVFDVHREA